MRLRLSLAALLLLAVSACVSSAGDTPDNPIRIVRPTREEIMTRYPPEALAQGISGRAIVRCEVVAGGLLDRCSVVSEDPANYGFGAAAVQVAFEHHVRADADGRFPVGKHVELPVDFTPPR